MRKTLPSLLVWLMLCTAGFAQTTASAQFRTVEVDAGKVSGLIRSFQGVNGPPFPVMEGLPSLVPEYKELRIDMVRTHDSYGPTEVDAHYTEEGLKILFPHPGLRAGVIKASAASLIFPDWNADPEKPESYNFAPTDKVIQAIRGSGAEVYFRIGRSAGGNPNPPADFDKFAAVIKHVAMHYSQGWANGFRDHIRYWEFWNEPDIGWFWGGTPEQLYTLYEKTARALKSVDPALKVGAPGKAFALGEGPYREEFLDYCAARKLPLDFYSWHIYSDFSYDPYDAVRIGQQIRSALDAKGFRGTESHLTEWNLSADFTEAEKPELTSIKNAAFIGAVMIYLQDSAVDRAHLYRGDAMWMGLFGPSGEYYKPAYTMRATGAMLDTPQRLAVTGADTFGFAALAGRSRDRKTVQVLINNYEIPADFKPPILRLMAEWAKETPMAQGIDLSKIKMLPRRTDVKYQNNAGYDLTIQNLPWGKKAFTLKRYRLTKTEDFALVEETSGSGGRVKLSSSLPPPALELIVVQRR